MKKYLVATAVAILLGGSLVYANNNTSETNECCITQEDCCIAQEECCEILSECCD